MSATVMLAWAQRQGIDRNCAKPLRFHVSVMRYTEEAEKAARLALSESSADDARLRFTIWCYAGMALQLRRRDGVRQEAWLRRHVRECIVMLRRAWWAHCAQRPDLARAELAEAREAWLHIVQAPLFAAAAEAEIAKIRWHFEGKRNKAKAERDPNGYHDDWLREYRQIQSRRLNLSDNAIYTIIAGQWRGKDDDDTRTVSAIHKGIKEALTREKAGKRRHRSK